MGQNSGTIFSSKWIRNYVKKEMETEHGEQKEKQRERDRIVGLHINIWKIGKDLFCNTRVAFSALPAMHVPINS